MKGLRTNTAGWRGEVNLESRETEGTWERNLTFYTGAGYTAALISACLDQEDQRAMLRALASPATLTMTQLEAFIQERRIDPARLRTCTASRATRQTVWETSLRSHAAGVHATPTFRVNGLMDVSSVATPPSRRPTIDMIRRPPIEA